MQNQELKNFLTANVKDYSVGVELLAKYGGKARAVFYRKANPAFHAEKLYKILEFLANTTKERGDAIPISRLEPSPSASKEDKYPPSIIRSKAKLHELWLHLDEFQKRLIALGDANTDELCQQRVALMSERQPYVEAFEELYNLQQDFFADGLVPDRLVELLETLDGNIAKQDEKPATDFSDLSDVAIVKKRNSVRTQVKKWQNMLRFQSKTPTEELNPMPEGPKRAAIEAKIKSMQQDLAVLNGIIQSRGL